jgi:adenylate cyclase
LPWGQKAFWFEARDQAGKRRPPVPPSWGSKAVGADLLISESTAAFVPDFAMLEVGEVQLKGKSRPAKVFALLGDENLSRSLEFQELRRNHGALLEAIEARDAADARAALRACRTHAPDVQIYHRLELRVRELERGEVVAKAG